ncbi:MAG: pyridoxamine 5'-phosphate oxidase [Acidimicrobiales bacterium]
MDLSRLRIEYESIGLSKADLAPTWHEQLAAWIDAAVEAELPEPNGMVLATADADGGVQSRIVLLRELTDAGLVWFTNYDSDKGRALAANPVASITFSWLGLLRQAHVAGPVQRISDAESDAYFAGRPRGSQIGAWASAQSRVVADRKTLNDAFDEQERRFDGQDVPRPDDWGGYRLAPTMVEFWQGRERRLHDRLRYVRSVKGDWEIVRLWP